jgi:hypothetical protein
MFTSLLITVAGVVVLSVLKVPPQMRSVQFGGSFLPAFVAHGIRSQSSVQPLGPSDDGTAFCANVLPERVNARVQLFTEKQHTQIYM